MQKLREIEKTLKEVSGSANRHEYERQFFDSLETMIFEAESCIIDYEQLIQANRPLIPKSSIDGMAAAKAGDLHHKLRSEISKYRLIRNPTSHC